MINTPTKVLCVLTVGSVVATFSLVAAAIVEDLTTTSMAIPSVVDGMLNIDATLAPPTIDPMRMPELQAAAIGMSVVSAVLIILAFWALCKKSKSNIAEQIIVSEEEDVDLPEEVPEVGIGH